MGVCRYLYWKICFWDVQAPCSRCLFIFIINNKSKDSLLIQLGIVVFVNLHTFFPLYTTKSADAFLLNVRHYDMIRIGMLGFRWLTILIEVLMYCLPMHLKNGTELLSWPFQVGSFGCPLVSRCII